MKFDKKLKIIVIAVQPFPIGMAATNRIISYSKGLKEEGNVISIHLIRPTEDPRNIINNKVKGSYQGIDFKYFSGTNIWKKSKILNFVNYCKGLFHSQKSILCSQEIDCILSNSTNYLINFSYFLICKLKKIIFLRVEDEYPPMVYLKHKNYSKVWTWFYINTYYKLFDGMILISECLMRYYKPLMRKKAKQLLVPILVEPERFLKRPYFPEENPYIAYCGYLGGDKDGVPNLIKSFNIFSKYFPNYKLYLIGYTKNEKERNYLLDLISTLSLSKKVVLTGKVHRDQIPAYLCNASMLALSRPANKQAEGGFPTKLGEYLSTGNPVVATRVGDIPTYLMHKENAFLCEPDNIDDFAEKLIYVASNFKEAKIIADRGRELAISSFNYNFQATRIINFINNITNHEN
jgi:glycosyltransferase involved in cell wall biosynthesis